MKWLEALKKSLIKSKEYGDKAYSNALVGNISGAIVSMDDVSPLEHKMPVKLESENLIPYPYTPYSYESNGITYTDNGDGSVTVNGTATENSYHALQRQAYGVKLNAGETITLTGCPSGGSSTTYSLRLDNAKTFIRDNGNGITYTIRESIPFSVQICIGVGTTVENLTFYPKLQKGTVATPYTPFVPNDTEVTVKSFGKNLLPYPFYNTTTEKSGVTFTDNGDGSITIDGTATENVNFNFVYSYTNMFKKGTYTLSGMPAIERAYLRFECYQDNAYKTGVSDAGSGGTITIDEDYNQFRVYVRINSGVTVSKLVVRPMIEYGSTATPYEPYIEGETITTTLAEGAELTSIAPNMTITTDKGGVVIDTEYNKDSNIVIEKLTQAIISMGGIV